MSRFKITNQEIESVDLGLTSKIAAYNLGSTSPEDPGGYYAWGELTAKERYIKNNYRWYLKDNEQITKYGCEGDCANSDNVFRTVLDLEDDVAQKLLGGTWRTPSYNDIVEWHEKCIWKWESYKGVKGYLLTSKVDGYTDRSVFLPAAGIMLDTILLNEGYAGYYWASSVYNQNNTKALASVFDRNIIIRCLPNVRYAGLSIRPVCD